MGLDIFMHSIRQVFGNLSGALRVSLVLYLIQLAATYVLFGVGRVNDLVALQRAADSGALSIPSILLGLFISVATGLWIAVAWHRYVLRVEEPGEIVPSFRFDRMLEYLGYSVLIVIILVVISLAISLVFSPLARFVLGLGAFGQTIIGILIYVPVAVVGYRLSVVLPGAALGENIGISDAWERTAGSMVSLVLLSIFSAVSLVVITLSTKYATELGSIPSAIWSAITQWIVLMVGISILTTLYGVYVEDRKLS